MGKQSKAVKKSASDASLSEDDSIAGFDENEPAGSSRDSTNRSCSDSGNSTTEKKDKLVHKETQHVLCLRILVCLIMLMAAVSVSLVIYFMTYNSEINQYNVQFDGAAAKVIEAFMDVVNIKIGSAGSFVVALEAYGVDSDGEWPFHTLSYFQRRSKAVMQTTETISIGLNPLVPHDQRAQWENYTIHHPEAQWYQSAIDWQIDSGVQDMDRRGQLFTNDPNLNVTTGVANHIFELPNLHDHDEAIIATERPAYLPDWEMAPATHRTLVNRDRSDDTKDIWQCMESGQVVFGQLEHSPPGYQDQGDLKTEEMAWLLSYLNQKDSMYEGDLYSTVYIPLFGTFAADRKPVGVMRFTMLWSRYFEHVLPDTTQGLVFVLSDECGMSYTYVVNGRDCVPVGPGDLHDAQFDDMVQVSTYANVTNITDGTALGRTIFPTNCPMTIRVYPSADFEDVYTTSSPIVVTIAVAGVFVFTMIMFFIYDRLVEKRQRLILRKAEQTNAIVASLFPKNVRDRMMENESKGMAKGYKNTADDDQKGGAPIADLFPECTVMFCDIAGFTAWSSSRDPTQVFTLLGAIYQAFDNIAQRRKVFKVETIGDSYVAVTGLPKPQERHALVMARFAAECLVAMQGIVQQLETKLGPDTAELTMRFGLHSGPVTAGVLMGEKSRFQLFGDTVNTAARMESTGMRTKIQATKSTADLLMAAGKEHWVAKREDLVHAKGLGNLQTYWISPWATKTGTSTASSAAEGETGQVDKAAVDPVAQINLEEAKNKRLVNWMTELFKTYIKEIVAKRAVRSHRTTYDSSKFTLDSVVPLEEVVEVIELPKFDAKAAAALAQKGDTVEVPEEISNLLNEYITTIADSYNDNPFHNFEHACAVTMSVDKFLKRIVTPDVDETKLQEWRESGDSKDLAAQLHDYTHGINSDPVALFAIVFGALIHDCDHKGISNVQLCKEDDDMATLYDGKSVAEQHSLDLAWGILMNGKFDALRNFMFAAETEMKRFRQVIVNVVLATDIFDKELNDLRKARWNKAFSEEEDLSKTDQTGLRATIVLEHIIQASDVSHTMQHWHVYTKWNKRLFQEMTLAYRAGRMGVDPASFWYQGEIGFLENYVIPLAKKLKDCKVFGVNSDQCLVYAIKNRDEWEARGQEILDEYMEEFKDLGVQAPVAAPVAAPESAPESNSQKIKISDSSDPALARLLQRHAKRSVTAASALRMR